MLIDIGVNSVLQNAVFNTAIVSHSSEQRIARFIAHQIFGVIKRSKTTIYAYHKP